MKKEQASKTQCRFCYPIAKKRNKILYESPHLYVMASLGQIVEGYLLLLSKEHIKSCSKVAQLYPSEFSEVLTKMQMYLHNIYGSSIFFEHGKTDCCFYYEDNSHCFHSHLHMVPVSLSFDDLKRNKRLIYKGAGRKKTKVLKRAEEIKEPYIFTSGSDQNAALFLERKKLPKQFLRSYVAKELGTPERADWRDYEGEDLMKRAEAKAVKYFQNNKALTTTHT